MWHNERQEPEHLIRHNAKLQIIRGHCTDTHNHTQTI